MNEATGPSGEKWTLTSKANSTARAYKLLLLAIASGHLFYLGYYFTRTGGILKHAAEDIAGFLVLLLLISLPLALMAFLSGVGESRAAVRTVGAGAVGAAGLLLLHTNITGPSDPSLALTFPAVAAIELVGVLVLAIILAFVPKEQSAL